MTSAKSNPIFSSGSSQTLVRSISLPEAIVLGLGSILGTGVFVSLGLAAGIGGPKMLLAITVAGFLALCNGLSTAQLAANHPVSGGTYEYGYKFIGPWAGFGAGWLFCCAKSASAATAAVGFGSYIVKILQLSGVMPWHVGLAALMFATILALLSIQKSTVANMLLVIVTLTSLVVYVSFLSTRFDSTRFFESLSQGVKGDELSAFGEATALIFVAFTGYGRIATLGEEVKDPTRTIPRAIFATLTVAVILYSAVAVSSIGAVGAEVYGNLTALSGAPLEAIAFNYGNQSLALLMATGATSAMFGVLLNLILGISRVILAMGRRGDLPDVFAKVGSRFHVPYVAVCFTAAGIGLLVVLADIRLTWSLSAVTVLLYYAVTNGAALKLSSGMRLYPKIFAWFGLIGCLGFGLSVNVQSIVVGAGLLSIGVVWRTLFRGDSRS